MQRDPYKIIQGFLKILFFFRLFPSGVATSDFCETFNLPVNVTFGAIINGQGLSDFANFNLMCIINNGHFLSLDVGA